MTPEEQAAADAAAKKEQNSDSQGTPDASQQDGTEQDPIDEQAQVNQDVEQKRAAQLAEANEKILPTGFTKPSVGRIVHFYPHPNDKQARANKVEFIAAIITREYGDHRVDLRIFPAIEEKSMYTRRVAVPHRLKAAAPEVITTGSWDWPNRG